jgi:serine/threonine-protein kinase
MAMAIERASPLATASDVGAWVEVLAHEVIVERAARVAEIESRSDVFMKPAPAEIEVTFSEEPVHPPASRARSRAIAALVVGLAVAAGFGIANLGRAPARQQVEPRAQSAEPPAASIPPSPPTPVAASAQPPPPDHATTPPVEETPSAVPSTKPAPVKAMTKPTPAPPAPKPHPDCSQPFAIDANGIKHVKPECL